MLSTPTDPAASWETLAVESGYIQLQTGVPMFKTTDDLDRYRKVIESTRPQVVVETGTRFGGSARWFASLGVNVITVDIAGLPLHDGGCVFLRGDAADRRVAELIAGLVDGRRCMVSLDSDHHAPHVAQEIRLYGPLVSPGCYLVVEDGLADLVAPEHGRRLAPDIARQGGPLVAIEAELAGDPAWRRDEEIEALSPVTHHPAGWWVRCG